MLGNIENSAFGKTKVRKKILFRKNVILKIVTYFHQHEKGA